MKRISLLESIELQQEIDQMLDELINSDDMAEREMYRQMIKVNIYLIKDLLRR